MEKQSFKINSVWDSSAEAHCHDILKELINTQNYHIFPHVCLKDIFSTGIQEEWANFSIDFLIADFLGMPVLGIEINGIKHLNNELCRKHDQIKKELFSLNRIPLITVPIYEMNTYDAKDYKERYKADLKLLIAVHLLPLYYRSAYPSYCPLCKTQYTYKLQNDYSGSFYFCANPECLNCQEKRTLNYDKVPNLLNPSFINFVQKLTNSL